MFTDPIYWLFGILILVVYIFLLCRLRAHEHFGRLQEAQSDQWYPNLTARSPRPRGAHSERPAPRAGRVPTKTLLTDLLASLKRGQ